MYMPIVACVCLCPNLHNVCGTQEVSDIAPLFTTHRTIEKQSPSKQRCCNMFDMTTAPSRVLSNSAVYGHKLPKGDQYNAPKLGSETTD